MIIQGAKITTTQEVIVIEIHLVVITQIGTVEIGPYVQLQLKLITSAKLKAIQ
jgi:hypothetical protein